MDSVASRLDDIAGGDAGKKLRLVTVKEDEHYKQLKRRLDHDKLKTEDVNHIITHMFANRTRFKAYVSIMDIAKDVFTSIFGPFKFFCMSILVFPVFCKPKRGS